MAQDWTVSGNQLVYGGSGPAPYLSPELQRQLRASGGGATPAGAQTGVYSPSPGASPVALPSITSGSMETGMESGGGGSNPGLVDYKPGPITSIVNDLLHAAISGGGGGGPAGTTLHSLAGGQIPAATLAAYRQNQALEDASITESMGKVGNRFGTDLARTIADAAGRSNVNLSASAMDRALAAIQQIIGLGTGQSNLEFAGNQAALDRANQDFLASSANEGLPPWLIALLQSGGS